MCIWLGISHPDQGTFASSRPQAPRGAPSTLTLCVAEAAAAKAAFRMELVTLMDGQGLRAAAG